MRDVVSSTVCPSEPFSQMRAILKMDVTRIRFSGFEREQQAWLGEPFEGVQAHGLEVQF